MKFKQSIVSLFLGLIMVVVLAPEALAQPGLPTAPSQAPIDGGLVFLAIAGGAYALKQLKRKE